MSNVIRNLQESVILQNLMILMYPKMIKNPDKPAYKIVREFSNKETHVIFESAKKEVVVNLMKEIFVLINQMWSNDSFMFNEGLINQRNVYNLIRSQISKDGKTLPFNNKELYKRIRQSIVHNSKDAANFSFNLEDFQLNLGKVNGEDYIINLDIEQLITLMSVLFSNINYGDGKLKIYTTPIKHLSTKQDVYDNIRVENEKGELVKVDANQAERVFNYFRYIKKQADFEGEEFKKVFVFPENSMNLFSEKLSALTMITMMQSKKSWNDLKREYPFALNDFEMMNCYYSLISNLLFTVVSAQSNEELNSMVEGCFGPLTKDQVRHLRNSLCHGRYFYDYFKTFYFYDGKKELNCELKLSITDINRLIDKLAKGKFAVHMLS